VTEVVHGLDGDGRSRVAALRAEGRFFWLDVSLSDTRRAEIAEALALPERAASAMASGSTRFCPTRWQSSFLWTEVRGTSCTRSSTRCS
jgi:hypothetical protein